MIQAVVAIEEFHRANITLEIRLPRPGRKGLMELTARATRRLPLFGAASPSVSRSVTIYGGDPVMAAATGFRLVYDLDKDCGAMWAQAELFGSL